MRRRERILAALVVLLGIGVAAALFADITLRGQVSDNRDLVHALQKQVRDLGGNPLTQVPKPTPTATPKAMRPTPQPTTAPARPRTVVVTSRPAATPRPSPSRTSRPSPKPTPSRPPSPTPSPTSSLCVPVVGCVPAPAVGDH